MPCYRITHRYTNEIFKTTAPSKASLKRDLVRYIEGDGYSSFWTIEEIDERTYGKLSAEGVPQKYLAKPNNPP